MLYLVTEYAKNGEIFGKCFVSVFSFNDTPAFSDQITVDLCVGVTWYIGTKMLWYQTFTMVQYNCFANFSGVKCESKVHKCNNA